MYNLCPAALPQYNFLPSNLRPWKVRLLVIRARPSLNNGPGSGVQGQPQACDQFSHTVTEKGPVLVLKLCCHHFRFLVLSLSQCFLSGACAWAEVVYKICVHLLGHGLHIEFTIPPKHRARCSGRLQARAG